MGGIENYLKQPRKKIERVLAACGWEQIGDGLWEKGLCRLYVDSVGIFLFLALLEGPWLRTHGLSHNLIFPGTRKITFKDLSTLDLMTGEWNGMDSSVS